MGAGVTGRSLWVTVCNDLHMTVRAKDMARTLQTQAV